MVEPSNLSGATTHRSNEVSDSNSSSHQFPIKHPTHVHASKFKGVVSQQNGHWGAQIYANHQRIWLGTFKSEKEAAMAYDSAAIKLRNGDSHRNFPWTSITVCEPKFQTQFTTEAILSMIKDGSYAAKFSDYMRAQLQQGHCLTTLHGPTNGVKWRQLFQKELTPSDVSKLNRLVIPKKYAVKYFPRISDVEEKNGGSEHDVELVFYDRLMRSWKFSYCYWKSSQSFVFTRGWNRFAKEKGLRPRDRVIFYAYECGDGFGEIQKVCIIDVAYSDGAQGGALVESISNEEGLGLKIRQPGFDEVEKMELLADFAQNVKEIEGKHGCGEVKDNAGAFSINAEKKGFKLFGVQIM
ncbi:hypothetical protein BUALT_Bualt12G0081700 [Buddleja alternifolia]|uniref:AP2/ERF and B3 domain-containing transcription factor n=1 Tax=Buddleja alternifolia TaxID=168488 RepID=A0AAV6WXL6_9LAMI|nr:hypothetical protein BUALT_Bualt12G0081700 [Buddleja alternifolia]